MSRRYAAPLVSCIPIAFLWWFFYTYDIADRGDALLGGLVAVQLLFALVLMVRYSDGWNARTLGYFFLTCAVFVLFAVLGYANFHDRGAPPWTIDLVRALIVYGSPFFTYGVWKYRTVQREANCDDYCLQLDNAGTD